VTIEGDKYYFQYNGRMVVGLKKISNKYYWFDKDGKMVISQWITLDDGEQHFFQYNGRMVVNQVKKINGKYYYLDENGAMVKNAWIEYKEDTYYFQDNGRAYANSWQTIEKANYYFQPNGRLAKDNFVTIDGKLYYFDKDAAVVKNGWHCVDSAKAYCYADANGVLSTNKVIEGYKLNASGQCTTKYRVIQLVKSHTKESMTDQEKIKALYDWLMKNSMKYYRTYEHVKANWVWKDSWVDDMAASQLDQWGGNCFRYAALFGMLVHEATALPVIVYHGYYYSSPHGWITVEQGGKLYMYDVEMDKHNTLTTAQCYKVLYSKTTSVYRNGVGTKIY